MLAIKTTTNIWAGDRKKTYPKIPKFSRSCLAQVNRSKKPLKPQIADAV